MNIKPITREEATIRVLAEPDEVPVEGNACASGDNAFDQEVEQGILARLEQGDVWAWAAVTVIVTWASFEARTHLGCCSYDSEDDFKQHGGYFDDMVAEALDDLNRTIGDTYQRIKEREMAA
jgi:hypothetical protein